MKNVINLGCRLNHSESEYINKILLSSKNSDTIVVNTCAVTNEAERQSRQSIRKIHKASPDKKIIVTGCAAQINPSQFENIDGVYKIIGNSNKTNEEVYKTENLNKREKILVDDIMEIKETTHYFAIDFDNFSRAFVQVQNGCNYRCSYCIIPYGRGNSRSIKSSQIISQIQQILQNGITEIVITGVNITSYIDPEDGKSNLGDLCEKILKNIPNLNRLRISSLDPNEMDEKLIDIICNEKKILPHVHLSVQSGDDFILQKMKRRHSRNDVFKVCDEIKKRRSQVQFGCDIICGFPNETHDMFMNTVDLVKRIPITFLHAFPYSKRYNTIAARMENQIDEKIKKERTKTLIGIANKIKLNQMKSFIGKEIYVLTEKNNFAKTDDFFTCKITNKDVQENISIKCKVEGIDKNSLHFTLLAN